MPPSAGACQTTDAALKPDCGRAGDRSSTITAIGWRFAAVGLTSRPVSGAATRVGPGVAVGSGIWLGVDVGVEPGDGETSICEGVVMGPAVATLEEAALPEAAIWPEPEACGLAGAPRTAANIPKA